MLKNVPPPPPKKLLRQVNLNDGDSLGRTSIHLAASNGCVEALNWLAAQPDVDVNVMDRCGRRTCSATRNSLRNPSATHGRRCGRRSQSDLLRNRNVTEGRRT